jgi:hypothetical protein
MRKKPAVACGVQVLTMATILAYRVNKEGRAASAGDEASSPAA